jgi:molybdopterin-guanine dinucleotide biosynthesis protein A
MSHVFNLTMVSAIIVAVGKGTRMGPTVDKLWLDVAGRPAIAPMCANRKYKPQFSREMRIAV